MRILVTGGARRIGAGIARRLALRGHAVAIHHHHAPDDAEALRAAIAAAGGQPASCRASSPTRPPRPR
jgi:NAD(P)-dependent dehydrogenase (short-subunit alcohol dehydrogenase family)